MTSFLGSLGAWILTLPSLVTPLPDEGMWMLHQLRDLPLDTMRARGLALDPSEIADPTGRTVTIQNAIVRLAGRGSYGTSSFVSDRGLLFTNHHVAFGAIQQNSSVGSDRITNGFLASSLEEELPCPGFTAFITLSMEDVTPAIREVLDAGGSPAEVQQRLSARVRELTEAAPTGPGEFAQITEFDSGHAFYLIRYLALRDIRLVYAPPRSIGEYGGDTDNWMWPRHSGDFAFMRAYVASDGQPSEYAADNVPYTPKRHLRFARAGAAPGDFVFVMGYPGATFRYRSSYSLQHRAERSHPTEIALLQAQADLLHELMGNDRELQIRYADEIRGIENVLKNRKGMVDGMRLQDVVGQAREREARLEAFLRADPERWERFGDVLPRIGAAYEELWEYDQKQQFLQGVLDQSPLFVLATELAEMFRNRPESAVARAQALATFDQSFANTLEDTGIDHERHRLHRLLAIGLDLPGGQRIRGLEQALGSATSPTHRRDALRRVVDDWFSKSILFDVDARKAQFETGGTTWEDDVAIAMTRAFVEELEEVAPRWNEFVQVVRVERPRLMEAFAEWLGKDLYPDANATLRLTHGVVRGYAPRDAVAYGPLTTVAGMLAKDQGVYPFDAPAEVREVHDRRDLGPWIDESIGDVPVCSLSDTDITGGNSGSPIMNGRGEVVGIVFDGVYEGMISDYVFDDDVVRTISVDVRYVNFLLDKVYGATSLLKELGIRD